MIAERESFSDYVRVRIKFPFPEIKAENESRGYGTVKEIRALQEQVAEELGQRAERTETVDLNKLFEKMTPAELEAYASHGTLPAWFPAQRQ